jgi:uracil-DNA glycosylase
LATHTQVSIPNIPAAWQLESPDFIEAWREQTQFLEFEYSSFTVFPAPNHIFKALEYMTPQQVSVVVLGQDPYHNGAASGLAFGVKESWEKTPPSLLNIFKEIYQNSHSSIVKPTSEEKTLEHWAMQKVLLLNTILTVRTGEPLSHAHSHWNTIVIAWLKHIVSVNHQCLFLCLGEQASNLALKIQTADFLVCTSHPSPLSAHRGFLGSQCFIEINKKLIQHNKKPIVW